MARRLLCGLEAMNMPFTKAKLLRHPLLLLAFGFMLQMCASNSGQNTSAGSGASTTTGDPPATCSVVGDCSYPASHCSSDSATLIYYINPSCTNGLCSFLEQRLPCPCSNGGCIGTGTAAGVGTSTSGPGVTTAGGVSTSGPISTAGPGPVTTAGPVGVGGFGGLGGQSGAGGLGDRDASDEGDAAGDADAALQACNSPNDCAFPPSYCKDSNTIVFAQQATCTAHVCGFVLSQMTCTCINNGCNSTTTK
jgi:hypothetical protein